MPYDIQYVRTNLEICIYSQTTNRGSAKNNIMVGTIFIILKSLSSSSSSCIIITGYFVVSFCLACLVEIATDLDHGHGGYSDCYNFSFHHHHHHADSAAATIVATIQPPRSSRSCLSLFFFFCCCCCCHRPYNY
mmetsp:Transcript_3020/g.4748  ORF Transcript_3020/g.4748 Transcript_3020/m.4748 type:complete len:134 (-) Transcript_3020:114-515(-)